MSDTAAINYTRLELTSMGCESALLKAAAKVLLRFTAFPKEGTLDGVFPDYVRTNEYE